MHRAARQHALDDGCGEHVVQRRVPRQKNGAQGFCDVPLSAAGPARRISSATARWPLPSTLAGSIGCSPGSESDNPRSDNLRNRNRIGQTPSWRRVAETHDEKRPDAVSSERCAVPGSSIRHRRRRRGLTRLTPNPIPTANLDCYLEPTKHTAVFRIQACVPPSPFSG